MTTWAMRFKPWLLVVMLALLVAGSTGLRPARLVAQAPEPVIEDEPWVQEALAGLCAGDIVCADPGAVETALRDCVRLTGHGLVSPSDARLVCRSYGERVRRGGNRPLEEIERRAFATADAEVAALAAAGGIDELTAQLRLGLISCLLSLQLDGGSDPIGAPRSNCPRIYGIVDGIWREATAQVFIFSRLAEGVTPEQAADELTRYDSCLQDELFFAPTVGGWSAAAQTCRDRVLAASGPPQGSITCTPSAPLAGATLTCTFQGSTESVASYQWSAPGGIPSSSQDSSLALRYDTDGRKQVDLTACRTADLTSCAVFTTVVIVQPNPPTVRAVACAPVRVEVNRDVSCSATEENVLAGSASRGWTAFGGDPADGRGPTFATRYGRPGNYTITYRLCNGSACVEGSAQIIVTAAATPTPTPMTACTQFDVSGTWQTAQGNGYNPAFAFQQSGTRISGTATLPGGEASRAGFTSSSGSISGTLVGNQLDVTVSWSGRSGPISGRYTATVGQISAGQGRLNGGSAGGQSWNGSGPLRCAASR